MNDFGQSRGSQDGGGSVEIYITDVLEVRSRGVRYDDEQLDLVLRERTAALLWDDTGREELEEILADVPSTEFEHARLQEVIDPAPEFEDWRVGEALAESYLVRDCSCEFPWPMSRDVRNPAASPSGADLVGFSMADGSAKFAFGEAKTSSEKRWPPQVMYSRTGLVAQLERLRDEVPAKAHLVRYLGFHAYRRSWLPTYQEAAGRFLADPDDVALYGVLVRDVEPRPDDLSGRTRILAEGRRDPTTIELQAQYLPIDALAGIVQRVRDLRSEA